MKILVLFVLSTFSLFGQISEFERLMGKQTQHWIYVSRPQDIATLEKFETLYEQNQDKRFTETGPYKIPKVVHFIWLGPNPFPPHSVENVRTWIAKNPDWTIKFWTDRKREAPCSSMEICDVNQFPFLFSQYRFDESNNWGEKSDVLRFEILYQEGGVYVDHDANCLQSFDGLHRGYNFYCGLEAPHPPFAGRNITCGNGIIGASPFHPVVGRVIELIGKSWEDLGHKYKGRDGYSRTQLVMERTYMMLTLSLLDRLNEDGNIDIVFPAAYFFAKKDIPPLYSKHFFANSWANEEDTEFEQETKSVLHKLQKRNKTIMLIGKGALSMNALAFAGIFLYRYRKRRKRI